MVNTRRKSHATDESSVQAAEQSDSSNTSTTRRSTRRSVGIVQPPKEVSTPPRRSRRLSNSSVESINNDTPRPATRRSTRNKTAGSDSETNDVELVVIKRRKVVEGVDTLVPICEEKNEAERPSQLQEKENKEAITLDNEAVNEGSEKTEITIVDSPKKGYEETVDLADESQESSPMEISPEESSPKKTSLIKSSPIRSSPTKSSSVKSSPIKLSPTKPSIEESSPKKSSPMKFSPTKSSPTKRQESQVGCLKESSLNSSEDVQQLKANTDNISKSPCKENNTATDNVAKVDVTAPLLPTTAEAEKIEISTTQDSCTDENKSLESVPNVETNAEVNSPIKTAQEKPTLLFGLPSDMITINKSFKLKLEKKQKPTRKGKKVEKKVEPKPALPCGADVMRNIPRGKSKSGREWKEPKSNPRYLYQDKGLKMPFEKITQLRQERKRVKDLENRMKEEEQARRAEIKRRREINKIREAENARRSEVVQVIRNTNKIKRMKKKQLKLIQKRDTTKIE